jgi:hypothetical protein
MELEGQGSNGGVSFGEFVLSTCVPSHVKAARKSVNDWTQVAENVFVSPSTNLIHECHANTCTSWVIRFVDGVRICAISGRLLMPNTGRSPRKRDLEIDNDESKRHQDKPIPGSTAYLTEKFGLESAMQIENQSTMDWTVGFPRLNQYPYN